MKNFLEWYKLDNAAKLYPILTTKNSQSLFRLCAVLYEEIKPRELEAALNQIIARFPTFKVKLRTGFFWYYIEENTKPLKVFPDDGIMLKPIDTRETDKYWFRVSYFGKKINLDMFHALSDGIGAMEFFKCLLHRYLTLLGHECGAENVINYLDAPKEEETVDSFFKEYQKTKLSVQSIKQFAGKKPLSVRGTLLRGQGYGAILGTVQFAELKEKAKELGTTVSVLLCALLADAIAKTQAQKRKKKPIVMMIPVNLRKIFGASTLRNFVLFTRLEIMPEAGKGLDAYIAECGAQLKEGTTREAMQARINTTGRFERAAIFRYMPLFLKYAAFKIGKLFLKSRQTTILSNLGDVSVASGMEIDRLMIHINVSPFSPVNVGIASVNGKTVVTFTRAIAETEIERVFFTSLVKLGVNVSVASNLREEQNVL